MSHPSLAAKKSTIEETKPTVQIIKVESQPQPQLTEIQLQVDFPKQFETSLIKLERANAELKAQVDELTAFLHIKSPNEELREEAYRAIIRALAVT
jgi:hypothetical protein